LPNSGELRPSTAAYDSALAGWEFIRGGYITATINNNLVPPGGWPMVDWYPTGATAQGYIDFLLNAWTIQNTGGATLIIQPPMSVQFYNDMRASLIAIRDSYNANTKSVSLSSAYGQSWNFGTTGSLSLPAPAPITFTATLVPVYHAGGGGDAWYYTVIFQPNTNGDVETMISGGSRVWDHNPGYQSGDSWNFTQADHGIPGYTFTLTLGIVNDLGGGQWSANFATGEGPEYPSTVKSPATIKLSADIKNWTFDTSGGLTLPGDFYIGPGEGSLGITSPDAVAIIANQGTTDQLWLFGTDGTLTLPGKIAFPQISGPTLELVEDTNLLIRSNASDGNANNTIRIANYVQGVASYGSDITLLKDRFTIGVNENKLWTFGADGSLELPQGSTINDNRSFNNFTAGTNYTSGSWGGDAVGFANASISLQHELSLLESGDFISITTVRTGTISTTVNGVYSGGAGGSLTVAASTGAGDSITSIELLDRTASGIELTTNSNTWTFGQSGELSLPAGGDVINSTGVSQLANRVEGSWTVATGTATYSFTVPSDGTYTMWVKGNIPNGIITWNATLSITNSNVPAIGQQYAWNYTGGGTPISLTAIPDQIRGSSGVISTDATYVGTTSNRFDFGISNSSGSSQTIYYGYTKV